MPVAVLVTGAIMGTEEISAKKFTNVSVIVTGVVIASFGEIEFVLIGFVYQLGGIVVEAIRLNLISSLLNGEKKMDALASLFYIAPICAVFNTIIALVWEVPNISANEVYAVGIWNFVANASVALLLNVSVVLLVSLHNGSMRFSILMHCTDWQVFWPDYDTLRCTEGRSSCSVIDCYLGNHDHKPPDCRVRHRIGRTLRLQDKARGKAAIHWQHFSSMGGVWCKAPNLPQVHCRCTCWIYTIRPPWQCSPYIRTSI